MKSFFVTVAVLCSYCYQIQVASAWVFPTRQVVQGWVAAAGVAGSITLAPLASNAADQSVFTHQYNDPGHPNCKRIIIVKGDGSASISGTDGNPGCPADGSGDVWRLVGDVDGDKIFVDFTPKGGPSNLRGVWEEKDTAGIRWPDGNKWTVKE